MDERIVAIENIKYSPSYDKMFRSNTGYMYVKGVKFDDGPYFDKLRTVFVNTGMDFSDFVFTIRNRPDVIRQADLFVYKPKFSMLSSPVVIGSYQVFRKDNDPPFHFYYTRFAENGLLYPLFCFLFAFLFIYHGVITNTEIPEWRLIAFVLSCVFLALGLKTYDWWCASRLNSKVEQFLKEKYNRAQLNTL